MRSMCSHMFDLVNSYWDLLGGKNYSFLFFGLPGLKNLQEVNARRIAKCLGIHRNLRMCVCMGYTHHLGKFLLTIT